MHPHPQLLGGQEHGIQHDVRALGEDVEHVADGGAAGQGQLGKADQGARVHHLGVQAGPDGVLGGQPLEELGVLRRHQAPREGLVEVVVGVDEAGQNDVTGEVEYGVGGGGQVGGGADLLDDVVYDVEATVGDFAALVVQGDEDGRVFDE